MYEGRSLLILRVKRSKVTGQSSLHMLKKIISGCGSVHCIQTSEVYHSTLREDPYCFLGQKVNGPDQRSEYLTSIHKFHMCITHYPGKTPVDFGVRRSKVKVTGKDCLQKCFCMITSVRINEMFSNFTLLSPIAQGKILLILVSKGQRSKSLVRIRNLFLYRSTV